MEEADISLESPFDTFWVVFTANLYAGYGELLRTRAVDLTWYTRRCLENGARVTGGEYSAALGGIEELKARFAEAFDRYDLLLTPTLPCTAFAAGDDHPGTIDGRETTYLGWTAFTYPVNLTGQPAASIPCGFVDGLPVGLQIIGGFRQDRTVLRAARAFEEMAPWVETRPRASGE